MGLKMKIEKMKLFWGCVLKYRFNYYPGMVTLTNQEMTATEKIVCYSHFPRRRGSHAMQGHMREAPGSVGRQKE